MREFDRSAEGVTARIRGEACCAEKRAGKPSVPAVAATRETVEPPVTVTSAIPSIFYAPISPLTAAQVLRDCSRRLQSSEAERRACRSLMRQAALNWRSSLKRGA
jgi:hypothetical protein